ncbi:MAG TPA: class I SAM-dependent methyltransferase [Jiangellaceae bacterium]
MGPHSDRLRWNARFSRELPVFEPHPLVGAALTAGLPEGSVLELACGRSGSALALAASGHRVIAVDVSDIALAQLAAEAERRELAARVKCVLADVATFDPGEERFAFVLATHFWDAAAFTTACTAVMPSGLLGWEALACEPEARSSRPWRIPHGELSARVPGRFTVLDEREIVVGDKRSTRLLARASV